MAGEWIAVDLSLPDKPEFQEIMDLTGRDEAWVEFLLIRMWGWASMHCADGTARMTMPRMVRTWGADEAFWRAVAAVGWLEIDETVATVAVPGWDRRFSQAAKARLQHRDRAAAQEDGRGRLRSSAGVPCAQAQAPPAPPRRRGEERRVEDPPPPRDASPVPAGHWERLRDAWNSGDTQNTRRRPWKPATAPDGIQTATDSPESLSAALEALERLRTCFYFTTPVPLTQFLLPGFIQRVLGGQYDSPKQSRQDRQDKPPAASKWGDEDRERFEATKRAVAAKLLEQSST